MSERKSWDVQPRRPQQAPPAPAPHPVRAPAARATPRTAPRPAVRRAPASPSGTLGERRRRKRRSARYVALGFLIVLVGASVYALWLPSLRVRTVDAAGLGADRAKAAALGQLSGTYAFVVPRDSILFLSKPALQQAVLDAVPEASAVSITRVSFSGIEVRTFPRAEAFVWCGATIDAPLPDGSCYQADSDGFIFAPAGSLDAAAASSAGATTTVERSGDPHGQVRIFAPLDRAVGRDESPVRAHVVTPGSIPAALKFVDALRELGAPVTALAIRDDEADLWLGGPTRVTYVLGREEDAALLAASALPTLNLTDGSIQYVDLRFPGKAYVKRYGE